VPSILVVDACTVISFGHAARLDLLTDLARYRVAVPVLVRQEVRRDPARAALLAAISAGRIEVLEPDLSVEAEVRALAEYDGRDAFRGRGEAQLLALARVRGLVVCSDERRVQRAAADDPAIGSGRVVNGLALLRAAVRERRLTVAEAGAVLPSLDFAAASMRTLAHRGIALGDYLAS
jgi:hypothetical protein